MWNATPWERTAKLLGEHRENQFLPNSYLSRQFNAYVPFRQATLLCGRNRESHIFHNAIVAYEGTQKTCMIIFFLGGLPSQNTKTTKNSHMSSSIYYSMLFFRMANFLLKYLCQNKYFYPRTLQLSDINQTLVLIGRVPSKAMVNLW